MFIYNDELYNADRKEEYIKEKTTETKIANNYLDILFKQTSRFENQLGKDVCDFTEEEILEFYRVSNKRSIDTIAVMHSALNQYTIWCMNKNLVKDYQNHYMLISKEQYSACVNKALQDMSFITRKTLNSWRNDMPNVSDVFLFYALFEGICGPKFCELVNLKYSDIKHGYAHLCTGRVIPISKELVNLAEASADENYYYTIGQRDLKVEFVEKDNNTIMKNYPTVKLDVSEHQKGRRIFNKVKRNFSQLGYPYLNASNLVNSGKVDFINRESEKLGISAHDYLFSNHIEEVNEQYGGKIVRSVFERVYKDYLYKG